MRQVLVTGASSDIGLAVCRRFLDDDCRVVAHYRTPRPELAALEAERGVVPLALDLSDPEALEDGLARNRDLITRSDVLVHCVGMLQSAPFAQVTARQLVDHFTVNTVSALALMRDVAPAMVQRGWGRIVLLSSIGVKFGGGSGSFAYALSKQALEYLPADHRAWAAANVLVNVVRVGLTDTRIHRQDPTKDMSRRVALVPCGRMAAPDEIAATVHWLGSDLNTFTTGQTIGVAGGE
ncbi:MAG TPA: SDR family oxidoreductase [Candidatus Omnitrophota bacterium]|nr:SDR family oxidoreductase [Candidatus Omnitrophota bacterium]